jgi:protein ImuA
MVKTADVFMGRHRAVVLDELRRLLPRIEGQRKALPFGLAALDSHLPEGGLACGALHEVVPETEGATAAAFGFVAAMLGRLFSPPPRGEGLGVGVERFCKSVGVSASPHDPPPHLPPQQGRELLFVMPAYGRHPHGRLHGHGLNALGLDPSRLILVETAHRKETLWAIEEALHSAAPAAVAGFIDTLDLKMSQRLHLAATNAGLPLFLLRPAPTLESSAAATRWRIGTAKAARDRFGLIVRPRWHLHLERCRNGRPGQWVVEYDHVAHRFSFPAAVAGSSHVRCASEAPLRTAHCA